MNPAVSSVPKARTWKAVIVERSQEARESIARELKEHGFNVVARLDRANHASIEVRSHKADLLMLEMADDDDATLAYIEELASEFRNLRVIVTAEKADADLILKVMRAGASEFLFQSFTSEELSEALLRVSRSLTPAPDSYGQLIAVYSPKGGLGTTTVAVNLAFALSRAHADQRIALIDTVFHGGDIPVFLDVSPQYTMADLLGKTRRIDLQLLETVLHRCSGNLWVLPEPGPAEEPESISSEGLKTMVENLRTGFGFIVADCEHQLNERTLAMLDHADSVVLVTDMSVPAIRQLHRSLELFKRLGFSDSKVRVVVNRHQTSDALRVTDLERSLKKVVHWRLPNDYKVASEAITRGKPLLRCAPKSKLADSFVRLAASLNSAEASNDRSGLSSRMRRMFVRAKGR